MATSTKPSTSKTGLVSRGCYAAPLKDCDGGPLTREHYISKNLLLRFGNTFTVEGLSWSDSPRELTEKAMTAKVLCKRHNNMLDSLDCTIGRLHDLLFHAHQGGHIGTHDFDGEDLERWALKVLLSLGASGNLLVDGQKERMEAPDLHLRLLFGEDEMPDGCGFYYIGGRVPALAADLFSIALERYPAGDCEAGAVYGVTVRLLDFQFVTSITQRLAPGPQKLEYRPHGFILGDPERGRIRLRWNRTPSTQVLVLKMRSPAPTTEDNFPCKA
jgi:hypothetical protein